ncbi:hypothetical protein [Spirosoma rhododendri]|uniref:Uncharacterized protein n=1 Tax=Spirosoma rhododendri TaxID=2728024 RepID=A0A7L5DI82_9BACT|nr:hypothetical protein [Spirosoma rhododendri]QJD77071.1 hypothetical protein HH216_00550 [Spirosoma rhododendri]
MKLPLDLLRTQNDIASMLTMLYSYEWADVYREMAEEEFRIAWGELTKEEATALLMLLNTAEQTGTINRQSPQLISLMPVAILKGLANAYVRLNPYKNVLTKIKDGEVTRLEAKILAGEISISRNEGTVLSGDQLINFVANAA